MMPQTDTSPIVGTASARLTTAPQSEVQVPAVFHRDTTLAEVSQALRGQDYVIATDDDGRIAGLATSRLIHSRLETRNGSERQRWLQMPLGALITAVFPDPASPGTASLDDDVECVAITENDQLFGISIGSDLFLSWRRIEKLLSIAFSDALTSLPNRLAYERRLREEWNRASRSGTSVAVIVIDLDHFKTVNDSYGHQAGDLVLTTVAHRLESCMRSYDLVARLGGDEFVALCLGCLPGTLSLPIRRLQKSLAEIDLRFDGRPVTTTASIGAAVRHDGFDSSDPSELFAAADKCLYRAKDSAQAAWMVEFGQSQAGVPQPVDLSSVSGTPPRPASNGCHMVLDTNVPANE